jgi:methyltransferase (TIGR00027 family)
VRKDRPSLTAQRVAVSRAAHQLYDHPRILDDPIAARIIGPQGRAELRKHRRRFEAPLACRLRAFLMARSRVAEEALAAAVARGVRQYVVLGAGLDTFAFRNPYPASLLRIFEADHPATQAWKRAQLSAAGIPLPESLTFVPLDFETQTLAAALREAGLNCEQPAFFSWLGVSMYLTHEAVMATLRYVASSLPQHSGIVFDYVVPLASVGIVPRLAARALLLRVAAVGEPWQAFFDPTVLAAQLRALGFTCTEDLGPEELNARFFRDRQDRLQVAGLGRVMRAQR